MATLDEVEAHRSAVDAIATLAVAELVAAWSDLPLTDPSDLAGPLADLLRDLIADFGSMSGLLGADLYEELRRAAGVRGSFVAKLAPAPPEEQVTASAAWAAAALKADVDKGLRDAAAFLERMVSNADRVTIISNSRRDPTAVRYARYASATACAFCAMLSVRQGVYRSEASALSVVGRGTARRNDGTAMDRRRLGVRARGSQALGEKFHNHCKCTVVPIWPGSSVEEAPYVADWREAYYDATESLGGASDTKAILAQMRQTAGLR